MEKPLSGAFPQFWGIDVRARRTAGGGLEAAEVFVGGERLDLSKTYGLAINDFIGAGGDGYDVFKKYEGRQFGTLEEMLRSFSTEKNGDAIMGAAAAVNLAVVD
jgi:5'-nucleotidase